MPIGHYETEDEYFGQRKGLRREASKGAQSGVTFVKTFGPDDGVFDVLYEGRYIGVYHEAASSLVVERPGSSSEEYANVLAQVLNAINSRWGVEPFVDEKF